MGLGKKIYGDGGNAGNILYLEKWQKAAKERIKYGTEERKVRNQKGGRTKRISGMRKGCWSGSSYISFIILHF